MIRNADARRSASHITTNSIRLSFVGSQVDCNTEYVLSSNVFYNVDGNLAIGKTTDTGVTNWDRQIIRNFLVNSGVALPENNISWATVHSLRVRAVLKWLGW